jgi:hypothetical protein
MSEFKTKQIKKQVVFNTDIDFIKEMDKCWKKVKVASRSDYIRQCIIRGNQTVNKSL